MRYAVVELKDMCSRCPNHVWADENYDHLSSCSLLKRVVEVGGVSPIPDDCPLPQNTALTPLGKQIARCYF